MNINDAKNIAQIGNNIQKDINASNLRCLEEPSPSSSQIIPESIFKNCGKNYIKRIVREINSSYEKGIHCGCAVMIRRLIETCMIEAFEAKGKEETIKNADGNYKGCSDIRNELKNNPFNNLSRNARKALNDNNIIQYGHNAAHDRYWITRKQDIDRIKENIRILIEYLVHQFNGDSK